MSKNPHFSILLISLLILIASGFYYYGSITQDTTTVADPAQNHTPQISSIPNPFSSGNMVIDSIPTQPTWETSSGKKVFYNTNWMGRTVIVDGKPIHYQFGSGNPIETDKSIEELVKMNIQCFDLNTSCDEIGDYESLSGHKNANGEWEFFDEKPFRMSSEFEYLIYSFYSNPIIRQSSESCGAYFATFWESHQKYGSGVGDYGMKLWWNPYRIDINDMLKIDPKTGRKTFDIYIIGSLHTQLETPSELEGGIHYTNYPLRDCLKKHNQLQLLQTHVASHYDRLQKLRFGK